MRLQVMAAVAGVLLMAGCVGAGVQESVLPGRIDYACAGNKVLRVGRATDGSRAAVLVDGQTVMLARAGSAAQEKYSDGNYTLFLDGERAMLENEGRVLFGPCHAGALPTITRDRY